MPDARAEPLAPRWVDEAALAERFGPWTASRPLRRILLELLRRRARRELRRGGAR